MSILDRNEGGFDARTLIAIVLMVVIITIGMSVQNVLFPREALPEAPPPESIPIESLEAAAPAAALSAASPQATDPTAPLAEARYRLSTDVFDAEFTNAGGELVSLRLKQHADASGPVEMLLDGRDGSRGFSTSLGGPAGQPLDALMSVSMPGEGVIEFSRTFYYRNAAGEDVPYAFRKRYEFKPGEYLFRLSVTVENSRPEALPLGDGTYAYSLSLGPQIGPEYETLPKNADFRKLVVMEAGKRKVINPKNGMETFSTRVSWAAVAGKYFALIAVPDATSYDATYRSTVADGFPVTTSISLSRPALGASAQTDVFHFYAGPKSARELARYDDPKQNGFKRANDRFEDVLEGGNMLGWLEAILKWALNVFYGIIPNYGVAIMFVTLMVRLVTFPLTFKGSKATARMQELQPKMQELQAKYKGNPQKLNQEMAEFYKREGYNPMSGCLPMLIQLPFFFAMYSLFNNHFDLRGASFIAGWINDLSLPEAVYSFPTINLVIWRVSAIRLLPVIYLASQLLYGKLMQQPTTSPGQSQGQMKFMMYGMPVVFFFVLYDVPSGLLVYWITSNVLTAVQQIVINRIIHKKKLEDAAAAPPLRIVPGKGKKGIKNGSN